MKYVDMAKLIYYPIWGNLNIIKNKKIAVIIIVWGWEEGKSAMTLFLKEWKVLQVPPVCIRISWFDIRGCINPVYPFLSSKMC